mgnify:CR=1 FL=1
MIRKEVRQWSIEFAVGDIYAGISTYMDHKSIYVCVWNGEELERILVNLKMHEKWREN